MSDEKPEKCSRCGEYLVYTDGHGFYRTLNTFTVKEQSRVYATPHKCKDLESTQKEQRPNEHP